MKIALVANTDWYLYNFRLLLAQTLREHGHEVVLASPPGSYVEHLQAAGFRWLPVPLSRRGAHLMGEMRSLLHLLRFYHAERPDIASHFTIKPVLYGSLAARMAGVPRVVNAVTGLGYVFYGVDRKASILRAAIRPLYRLSLRDTRIIFQNEADRQVFVQGNLARPDQTPLIPSSGIDVRRFAYSPFPSTSPVVVFNGRMLWSKGVSDFVDAARLLKQEGNPARFWLVGDSDPGNPESVPHEQLRQWQAEGMIEWLGWRDDMPQILSQAWLVCLPARAGEGFPRVLLEAAASGRAVITSDAPGCSQAVLDGESGLIVPRQNPQAFAAVLRSLLADPDRCRAMGLAGRQFVEQRFSSELIIKRTMAVYFS